MNDFFTNLSDIWGRLGALFSSYNFVVDTIDILLVALLVYKIIKFMRESRALHVVKGIILLLAAYFVVNLLAGAVDVTVGTVHPHKYQLNRKNFLGIQYSHELMPTLETY